MASPALYIERRRSPSFLLSIIPGNNALKNQNTCSRRVFISFAPTIVTDRVRPSCGPAPSNSRCHPPTPSSPRQPTIRSVNQPRRQVPVRSKCRARLSIRFLLRVYLYLLVTRKRAML
ncbi:hypothetical protein PILCRDRAFT_527939 [Piloderma croceum F 1598]|uniref:Uncharacterized protein n=1 Tax=Piloderma croceum (strain F 1598) TaxID=765440 RepID=A0A0C3B368_PILCF|nr:hypothetical protein PILCRDRAFT_527939 [Piloderma croceum F 1598]